MTTNAEIAIIVFSGFISVFFIAIGIMMHRFDFSCMFQHPFDPQKEGLYLRLGFKLKKLADATPENNRKFSNAMGNVYASIGALAFLLFAYYVVKLVL